MASAVNVFKRPLSSAADTVAALRELVAHNTTQRVLVGRHTLETFMRHYPFYTEEAARNAVREGMMFCVNRNNFGRVFDMMERWNRGHDFDLDKCSLVSHENRLWIEVACPTFGSASLVWLREQFPLSSWCTERVPGELDHEKFLGCVQRR